MNKSLKYLRGVFWVVVLLSFSSMASASVVPDSLRFRITFPVNSAEVRTELYDNSAVLYDFIEAFNELRRDGNVTDLFLSVRGNASVDGYVNQNKVLAGKRAKALSEFISSSFSIDGSLIRVLSEQPMCEEAEAFLSEFPDTLPGIDIPSIRRIIRTTCGSLLALELKKLDERSGGGNRAWFKKNILAPSRFAEIRISYNRTIPEPDTVEAASAVDTSSIRIPQVADVPVTDVPVAAEPVPEPLKREFRIGTNLLYDVAGVANLSLEYGFCHHLAVNVMATFSPWDLRVPDIKIRTLLVQPEVRWYFADNFKGHYLGVEGHYGWYNVALGGKTRYQDRDGSTPLWGAGLSYGYVLPFNEHWGMDFGISAGYARLVYDCFYNIENGAKFTTRTKDWWGPTRVGISIYYQF